MYKPDVSQSCNLANGKALQITNWHCWTDRYGQSPKVCHHNERFVLMVVNLPVEHGITKLNMSQSILSFLFIRLKNYFFILLQKYNTGTNLTNMMINIEGIMLFALRGKLA